MRLPEIGDAVPRRGNRFSRWLGRFTLSRFGWRIEGEVPNLARCVYIGAPHTSNWDFVHAVAAIFAVGVQISWMGKDILFRWPYGWFMRWLGGIPIDRSAAHGVVGQMVDEFDRRRQFWLGITPEGTRRAVARWKTGFYHIARGAEVPIVPVFLDYSRRVLGVGPLFVPTGDVDADIASLKSFYEGIAGKKERDETPRVRDLQREHRDEHR
jgi:1-acyl-sn-glycerol-3-phosphate acyltransferase